MSSLIVAHGDLDGITSAALLAEQLGMKKEDVNVVFTQPFLVDKVVIPEEVEKIYIVDIAINNRNPKMTQNFISDLGGKQLRWFDHHVGWEALDLDQDGIGMTWFDFSINHIAACAAMFGGASDIRVQDAIAADTREGELSPTGQLIERAIKSDMSNDTIRMWAVKLLMGDETYRNPLMAAERAYQLVENETYRLSQLYFVDGVKFSKTPDETYGEEPFPGRDFKGIIAYVDATNSNHNYDLTQLLLRGQELAAFAVVKTVNPQTKDEMVTVATKTGVNLVALFRLFGGAPFRVSLPAGRLEEVIEKLEVF